jgi:hypothetical protein
MLLVSYRGKQTHSKLQEWQQQIFNFVIEITQEVNLTCLAAETNMFMVLRKATEGSCDSDTSTWNYNKVGL